MTKALIFDLDGVIIDSMPLHTEAWRLYLKRLGIAANDSDIAGRMHGRRNDDIVAEFISGDLAPTEIFAHGAAKERLYRELMRSQLNRYLVPGIVAFLDRWRGFPLGVASNAEPANVDFVLDGAGLRDRFQVIVNGQQVDRPKPFPDVYLRASELLGVHPRDCVVFEDSPAGVEAALAAGMRVVAVQTHSADLKGVDLAIADFQDPQLEPWLRSTGQDE
jgi:beta-phosphoglucomutase family hydrolase